MINSVFDAGNWSKTNTENRVNKLLKRPTIQKLFEEYNYDFNNEKHKFLEFDDKSEQSWYLDANGNIQEKKGGKNNKGAKEDEEDVGDNSDTSKPRDNGKHPVHDIIDDEEVQESEHSKLL